MPTAHAEWELWSTGASVVVTDPELLEQATAIVHEVTGLVDDACSRFRTDSEISLLAPMLPAGTDVSDTLAALVAAALDAAEQTDGAVDPTLGNDLIALGYDTDIDLVRARDRARDLDARGDDAHTALPAPAPFTPVITTVTTVRTPGYKRVTLTGSHLTVPQDLLLDLGATAKAVAADGAAARIADELGCGALVCLGGDIATAGTAPDGGWQIEVQDLPEDPRQQVTLAGGFGMATSSTQKRRWATNGSQVHHILDPRLGLPVVAVWRSVTVVAESCLAANALSTAAVVKGQGATEWLTGIHADARLIDQAGRTITTGSWPAADDDAQTAQTAQTEELVNHG
ncbi:FAD:protein FMN transferase [Subtercola sp. PAMC28395]|uniref:FAD:protein FMN transferase n=1 Tax=Subtercola sp. PAMC28395 TaxID=2846775 RepID=UPI001C0CE729|nr:FAD:protein FMN transferase [Subtercola sp. PAMC28395]QWT24390.1 FAD:protein FMN transferase [Subtercola sp. PAMC28395]